MKKINITWFRVFYNYRRENGTISGDFNQVRENWTTNTSEANINKLMREFNKYAKGWSGRGYIQITSITAGAYDSAQKWAEKHNSKFTGKKIKFNN